MNSAASVYSSHSYYGSSGEVRSVAHQGSAAGWPHSHAQSHGISSVFDYYPHSVSSEYYNTYHPPLAGHCVGAPSSNGTPSPHGYEATANYWGSTSDPLYAQLAGEGVYSSFNGAKKKGIANNSKKERRRTISINGAFSNLRDCIPNVPKDTKLSKIKTLRLACGYIQHLMDALASDGNQPMQEFKADLSRKTPCRAEKRKCIEAEIAAAAERKSRGRSGWPQTIWAQDLKADPSSMPVSTTGYPPIKMKPYLATRESPACTSRVKPDLDSSGELDILDIPEPCASCHSSLCEESSSTAGSLG